MAKVGTYENARQLAPYYLLLFPAWLVTAGHTHVTRQSRWQRLVLLVIAFTVILVATLSERPLFPAKTLCNLMRPKFPASEFLLDECAHYRESDGQKVMARRNFLKRALPPGEPVIGLYANIPFEDDPGIELPYGQRRVECLLSNDPPERLRALGIHYAVVSGVAVKQAYGGLEKWLKKYNASLIDQYTFPTQSCLATDPQDIYLVRLN